jgi:hypothetical protein
MHSKKHLFVLSVIALLNGCSLGDAAGVLFRGMPEHVVPTSRTASLTIFAGPELNVKEGETSSRPVRICVYTHLTEDWSPPLDLVAKCAEPGPKLEKAEEVILVANHVANFSTRVPFQQNAWITVTGDFAQTGVVGNNVIKLKSPAEIDTCHWARVDKNVIAEVSKVSAGAQPVCK